ncbi:hypothetical protein [Aquimonas sp.]|jgi:type I restriction enzyme R subunit|uniref:hypothetical protein n=1 Tax=Aquimonas sp. TaxID=1872588 RepID=UPI0037BEC5DE
MSKLLEDLIQQSRADAAAYEEFLRKAEALVRQLAEKPADSDAPSILQGRHEAQVIYRNLPDILGLEAQARRAAEAKAGYSDLAGLASEIDRMMLERAPAGWRGDQAREAQVLNALFPLMNRNREATRALFELIKNLQGYR